jgi:hypothetical protein
LDSIGRMRSNTLIWDTHAPPETDTNSVFCYHVMGRGGD